MNTKANIRGYRRRTAPKSTVYVYVGAEMAAEIDEWSASERTSISTVCRAAIRVGLNHKEELYNEIDKEWSEKNDS